MPHQIRPRTGGRPISVGSGSVTGLDPTENGGARDPTEIATSGDLGRNRVENRTGSDRDRRPCVDVVSGAAPLGDVEAAEARRVEQRFGLAHPAAHPHRLEAGPCRLLVPDADSFVDEVVDPPPLQEL